MDVFDGGGIYLSLFNFTESDPHTESFGMLGIETKNFLVNSGSYFIVMFGILGFNLVYWFLNSIAKRCARFKSCRRMGIKVYNEDYKSDSTNNVIKLVLETHFDISMIAVLGLI